MTAISTAQIEALAAGDPAGLKAGRGLMASGKWPLRGHGHGMAWGECQGSGKDPYQVIVDLADFASRCSCPSRKFPCKHALGLLLALAANGVASGEPPDFAKTWMDQRRQRSERREARPAATEPAASDPSSRAGQRDERMQQGMTELQLWMVDLIRTGLAQLPSRGRDPWEQAASRLVNAQLPGVASSLRETARLVGSSDDWPSKVLGRLGTLQLLIDAFSQRARLTPGEQVDLRAALGQGLATERVLAEGERVRDRWTCLGCLQRKIDHLVQQRLFLYGLDSGRIAVILDYGPNTIAFEHGFTVGSTREAELAFYPSAAPQRAQVVTFLSDFLPYTAPSGLPSLEAAFDARAKRVAACPWFPETPLLIRAVKVAHHEGAHWLCDRSGQTLRVRGISWQLLALAGTCEIDLFGLLEGQLFQPIAMVAPCFATLSVEVGDE